MTMSSARRSSLALQGGFLLRIIQSRFRTQESCPASCECCTPWLPRPKMATFHVSSECEEPGCFYIYPPSCVNELPIKKTRIQIQITPSSLGEPSSERTQQRSVPPWPVDAAPPLAPLAPSLEIGRDVLSRIAISDASDQGISSPSVHGPSSSWACHL